MNTIPAVPAWQHRIVRVHNPLASFFDILDYEFQKDLPATYYGNFVSQAVVDRMFDAALCAFTGDADPVSAMRRLIPYKRGETVFVKINNTTTYDLWKGSWQTVAWDAHYNDLDAIAEPVNALLRVLTGMGIPHNAILVGDTTWSEGHPVSDKRTPRVTPNRVSRRIHAAFPDVVLLRSSFMPDGNGVTWNSNDPHAIVGFRDPVIDRRKERVTSHRLSDQVIGADHVINLPIMKSHDRAGISGALKNNFGTIASCAYFHEPHYAGPDVPGATFHAENHPAVDIWLNPHVGAKTRLILCDGIIGGWNWGWDPPCPWKQFLGRSPNCLLVGTDPVAMDCVIYNHVNESLAERLTAYPPPNMLLDASKTGLGRYELRPSPDAGYKTFEYREIEQKADAATLHRLGELRMAYRAGGKTGAEVQDLIATAHAELEQHPGRGACLL